MQATGGTITTNGSSKVHTFASSGTFNFYGKGTVKVLVVGGGADYYSSGIGGGAGQVLYDASYALSTGSYTVTINGIGGSSIFGTMTANPGSGSTSGSGYTCGSRAGGPYGASNGGGGGSAGNGGNAANYGDWTYGGAGGAGTTNDITGTNVIYACGGAGGPDGGGSNYAGQYGSRVYGDGRGSTDTLWFGFSGTTPNPCPALGGVIIISYVYDVEDALHIGGEAVAIEPLDNATHKVRFQTTSTTVGVALVDSGSAIAAHTRIYASSTAKAFAVLP